MIYFADLHIHSRFSRATSPACNLVELARWAALKGILLLASGDFTHPEWRHEIHEQLEDAEEGLFRLKKEFVPEFEPLPEGFGPGDVRFMLNGEISSIYKKGGSTRKVHNLVFMPDIDSMDRFSARLERIGNIASDGRPILGLDSRHLLEISLETSPDSFLVPAHVWTPWFSVLGSRSGFDSIEECFDELTPHIFALETGLSSDPEMNRRVASLDRYTLISNSDTHSPANLGREANILEGSLSYGAIREAIRSGGGGYEIVVDAASPRESLVKRPSSGDATGGSLTNDAAFIGTVEFFPEEGKYHFDGHRKCSARLDPEETEKLGGKCPVCGHPVTVGVMNRVMELADREAEQCSGNPVPFWRMVPLLEIAAQALGMGTQSVKVKGLHMELLRRLGPELYVLWSLPTDEIERNTPGIVAEGIARVRRGEVSIQAGYDGEYGSVQIFTASERDLFGGQDTFLQVETLSPKRMAGQRGKSVKKRPRKKPDAPPEPTSSLKPPLNKEQQEAISISHGPVVVKAGPGTGKTRTLTHRIASLMDSGEVFGREIAAMTFTKKAAQEMKDRLGDLMPSDRTQQCWVGTFHQLAARILELFRQKGTFRGRDRVLDRDEALGLFRAAVKDAGLRFSAGTVASVFDQVSRLKQNLSEGAYASDSDVHRAHRAYEDRLTEEEALDLDDLLIHAVRLLRDDPSTTRHIQETFARYVCVDEFQDVNKAQYEMVRLLAGGDGSRLFVIGDPDQAIYGFRGADWRFFESLKQDYPSASEVQLTYNYRSQPTILKAAHCVLDRGGSTALHPERGEGEPVRIARLPNAANEGRFITRTIEAMVGGASFLSVDSRMEALSIEKELSFEDFAVLYRLNAVGDSLEEAFEESGIPFQRARRDTPEEEAEARDPRAKSVSLMTIHAAKGLEFPVVFVAGCEEGIIPYVPAGDPEGEPADLQEERRLLYVAMTRARDHLFLTNAAKRVIFGRSVNPRPSPFLQSLEESLYVVVDGWDRRPTASETGPQQCELFEG